MEIILCFINYLAWSEKVYTDSLNSKEPDMFKWTHIFLSDYEEFLFKYTADFTSLLNQTQCRMCYVYLYFIRLRLINENILK
jgi:hypothetical protein